jgi:anti-sigma B factor antagonist
MACSPYLTIMTQRHGQEVLLCVQGELDASNRDSLREVIGSLLEPSPQTLVLDLSGLSFADCASLSILVSAHQHLAEQGRELIVLDAQQLIRRLLAVTGLDKVFHLSDSGTD